MANVLFYNIEIVIIVYKLSVHMTVYKCTIHLFCANNKLCCSWLFDFYIDTLFL